MTNRPHPTCQLRRRHRRHAVCLVTERQVAPWRITYGRATGRTQSSTPLTLADTDRRSCRRDKTCNNVGNLATSTNHVRGLAIMNAGAVRACCRTIRLWCVLFDRLLTALRNSSVACCGYSGPGCNTDVEPLAWTFQMIARMKSEKINAIVSGPIAAAHFGVHSTWRRPTA